MLRCLFLIKIDKLGRSDGVKGSFFRALRVVVCELCVLLVLFRAVRLCRLHKK